MQVILAGTSPTAFQKLRHLEQTKKIMVKPQKSYTKAAFTNTRVNNTDDLDSEDPVLERTFRGHNGTITSIDFCPTMKKLTSASMDATIMLWSFKPNLRAFKYIGHEV